MSNEDKEEIVLRLKAANMPMVRTFITGTVVVCSTVIGGVVYIKTTFSNHELRIGAMEKKWDRFEDKLLTLKK